ncbi:MAG TPA: CoA transferase [Methylomirabilota bacterium]|jgi:crotonobetainyl-CoA:carnitine CoA-transferase CaiB-like acyl-CoA transferase|nr:CoA transferase [Methylomirabilota bacterium]
MPGPLDGVRILDCTSVVLGPWAAQQLGDLGADVIKIEPPEGDTTRQLGPRRHATMAAFYLGCNRSKRSLVLDLKHEAGKRALFKLAERADVLMHNFRPEPAARLGISYEAFEQINPRLVYVATYGYRTGGPYSNKAAYDDIIQAGAGLAWLQTAVAETPRYLPTIVADKTSSNAVVSAVLAALYARERTGAGQAVEVPMFETLAAFVMVEHLYGETFVPAIDTPGYKRILSSQRRPYATRDGFLAILPYTDGHWREFCELIGRTELLEDARFTTIANRLANVEAYYATLAGIVSTRSSAEWLTLLEKSNVPHGPVNSLQTLLADPQLMATGFWKVVEHPSEGTLRMPDIPPRFSKTPAEIRRLPPRLGEHSVEVLGEAGFSASDIDRMLASGVTAAPRDGS